MPKKMSNEEFKNIIKKKFNNKIIPLDDFISYRKSTNMKFKCTEKYHDEIFTISSQQILRTNSKGCPFCNKQGYTDSMVKNLLKEKYDDNITLKNKWVYGRDTVDTKIKFICHEHGEFESTLNLVLFKYDVACPKCGSIKKGKTRSRVGLNNLLSHMNKCNFSYKEGTFKNVNSNATFICEKHGEFNRHPSKIIYEGRYTCPRCSISNGEQAILNILEELGFIEGKDFIFQYKLNNLRCDFYFEALNIMIEFDGIQHHDINNKYFSESNIVNDNYKDEYCMSNNIYMVRFKDNSKGINNKKLTILKNSLNRILIKKEFSSTTIETISLYDRRE